MNLPPRVETRQLFAVGALAFSMTLALAGCQYIGAAPTASPVGMASDVPMASAEPSPLPAPSTEAPTPRPTPNASANHSAEFDATLRAQAEGTLARWAEFIADAPPEAIVFADDLTHGGGWNGNDASDRKSAFLSGMVEASIDLPNDAPPATDVVWSDGSRQQVELISAPDALNQMVDDLSHSGGSCEGCSPLEVVGAELVTDDRVTSRGDATVPVWQFQFAGDDVPLTPITQVAVKDAISNRDLGFEGDRAPEIQGAYGHPDDSDVTVTYLGGACDGSYETDTVESDTAIVVLVRGVDGSRGPCITVGVIYSLPVKLQGPLGNRVLLDIWSGYPAPIYPEEPPAAN